MIDNLQCKLTKLVYHGQLTQDDGERIRNALETKNAMKPEFQLTAHRTCNRCGFDLSVEYVNVKNEKTIINLDHWNYCPMCSQKIDWSEVEWIETSEGTMCSNCHKFPYDDGEYHIANWHSDFCPHCGAKMKGVNIFDMMDEPQTERSE